MEKECSADGGMAAVLAWMSGSLLCVFLHHFVCLFISRVFVQSCCLSFPVVLRGFDEKAAHLRQPVARFLSHDISL